MSTPEHSPLGRDTVYADRYDASLLFPIPRADKRAEIGVAETLPFHGVDIWNAYELSWLDPRGKPQVALAEFRVPASSPHIIESKSFKLYLNGFAQERIVDAETLASTLMHDLSAAAGAVVSVQLHPARADALAVVDLDGQLLDEQDIAIDHYGPPDADFLQVDVTATPVASQDPDGQTQRLMGERTDDVEAFSRGDEHALFHPESSDSKVELAKAIVNAKIARATGMQFNVGAFQVSNLDEARDQWSHRFARPEQVDLVKKSFAARRLNRDAASARALVFLSGDIHIGCIFDLKARLPSASAVSLTSSGISQIDDTQPLVGTFIDESFSVAPGITSTLREVVNQFNFGVVQVQPTGRGAQISAVLAHEGNGFAYGLDVKDLI